MGRPRKVVDEGVTEMTADELELAGERIKDKKSPFADSPLKTAEPTILETADGRKIKQFGNFANPVQMGSAPTLKHFAKIVTKKNHKWIPMTNKDALEYQKQGRLVGHDPDMGVGLLTELE